MAISTDSKLNIIIIALIVLLICSIVTIIKLYKSGSEHYIESSSTKQQMISCPTCSMFHSITRNCSILPYELKQVCLNDKEAMDELYTALGSFLKLTKTQIDEQFSQGKIGWREIIDSVNAFPGRFNTLGQKMASYKNRNGENSMKQYCDFAFMSDQTKKGPLACMNI